MWVLDMFSEDRLYMVITFRRGLNIQRWFSCDCWPCFGHRRKLNKYSNQNGEGSNLEVVKEDKELLMS
ncbi:hypothetical protein IFM89_010806 [Coptis chinensis]|uniref:Uncharacterized protein n=1 Tax=Coptis chinensis TaxID=261450 RepID=A0A835IPV7_9MAGN|nr:hypothetical protein IFM89_010806 [Coptis chinensis]